MPLPNKLSKVPVYKFLINFPFFKAGYQTGITQNAFDKAPGLSCPSFYTDFNYTFPVKRLQIGFQYLSPEGCEPKTARQYGAKGRFT